MGVILAIVCVAILVVGYLAYTALYRPQVLFEQPDQSTAEATVQTTPAFDIQDYLPVEETPKAGIETIPPELLATAVPTAVQPERTPAPTKKSGEQMSGIVNVALFGIDSREDGSTTSGTMPHTDVNMVVAINFDTETLGFF